MSMYQGLVPITTTSYLATALASSKRVDMRGGAGVEIAVSDKDAWIKFGDSTVTATAGTASEILVLAGQPAFYPRPGWVDAAGNSVITHVAIIERAASAVGSVTVFG